MFYSGDWDMVKKMFQGCDIKFIFSKFSSSLDFNIGLILWTFWAIYGRNVLYQALGKVLLNSCFRFCLIFGSLLAFWILTGYFFKVRVRPSNFYVLSYRLTTFTLWTFWCHVIFGSFSFFGPFWVFGVGERSAHHFGVYAYRV